MKFTQTVRGRQRRAFHASRKAAALRKEAARYVDGRGKYRVLVSQSKAFLKRGPVADA